MSNILIILSLVKMTLSTIVPVVMHEGIPKVKMLPILESGEFGTAELFEFDTVTSVSNIAQYENDINVLFFLGAGEGIVGTPLTRQEIGLENFDERSYLGLEPTSQMYRQYLEGVMLVPGKLDENFPIDTEISMVLNPENVGLYCDEESILYIELIQRSFMFTAETGLVVNGLQQTNHPPRSFMLLFLEAFDHLPASVFGELMERITAENSTVDSSFNVHECDMTRYPNIVFRLGDLNNNYRGSIEYAPDDYLKPISGSNRCELKIRPTRNTPYFGANFLSMIAVHLKSDRVGFCDP